MHTSCGNFSFQVAMFLMLKLLWSSMFWWSFKWECMEDDTQTGFHYEKNSVWVCVRTHTLLFGLPNTNRFVLTPLWAFCSPGGTILIRKMFLLNTIRNCKWLKDFLKNFSFWQFLVWSWCNHVSKYRNASGPLPWPSKSLGLQAWDRIKLCLWREGPTT